MINVEIQKNGTENAMGVLKRFTKRVQGSGVLNRVRGLRYAERSPSRYVRKKRALKGLRRRTEIAELIKLGKPIDTGR
jgi:ribosomal protein S21